MNFPKSVSLSFENLSRLVTSPDALSHLQDVKLDGGHTVSSQWFGPQLLTFLKYAIKLVQLDPELPDLLVLLRRLDDLASDCKNFLEIILSFMPELNKCFPIQTPLCYNTDFPAISMYWEIFIEFLFETIGELLKCPTDSSILVNNQLKFLFKELNFLIAFLVDPILDQQKSKNENVYREIEAVLNEIGLFLHSFFFTTDVVTVTKMDLAVFVLLERIEIVQMKIKNLSISELSSEVGNGSLDSPSEVSSSQDKSIPMVEETIVGFGDITTQIASKLVGGPSCCQIVSIIGMGGLGKTTLAKKVYNCHNVQSYFHKLSWCVVSQTYNKRKLLIGILSSICDLNEDNISNIKDEDLAERLYKNLKGRRYLIVMDDLWDKEAWDDLKRLFPDDRNGSRVLMTSRQKNTAWEISHVIIEPPPLTPCESWNLLEQNVFKKEHCPEELKEIGQQIATNCHGLPLSIIIIAGVLSNMEKKQSLWQQVAKSLSCYISQKADDYIPTLKLSYMHLPNHLKPCFLYLGAFEEDLVIPVRKLLLLWIAEGFIEKKDHKTLEDVAQEYLMELVNRSLLQVSKRRSDNGVKRCTLHDLVLDMCRKLAVEDEIFLFQHHFLLSKCLRLSDHVLISKNLSEAFSIVYSPEKFRILESRSPGLGIKNMPDLRHLTLLSSEPSIVKLRNLEYLCLRFEDELPTYLLNMPKLRHLRVNSEFRHFRGARFTKNCDSSRINCLQTLGCVHISDSEEEILRCSPNLRTLKCILSDNHFPDLNFLSHLDSLKISSNHERMFNGDYSVIKFPMNIKNLTLLGMNLPYEKMSLIGTLPNLEILKLEYNTSGGKIWDTKDDEFQKLKFLKLGYLSLEHWNSSNDHFPVLERLVLEGCRDLEMIPSEFSKISTLQKIVVYYCCKKVDSSALEIRQEQQDYGNEEFDVTIIACTE